jgi:hypothetical protein
MEDIVTRFLNEATKEEKKRVERISLYLFSGESFDNVVGSTAEKLISMIISDSWKKREYNRQKAVAEMSGAALGIRKD